MSTLAEPRASETVCARCGAQLAIYQDWCLECGTAVNAPIRTAPDWRVPLAIVGGVVAVTAAAFVFVLISLSNSSDRSAAAVVAAAPATTALPAAATTLQPPATTTAPAGAATTPSTATFASWPSGVTGYTVVLTDVPSKAAATTSATRLAAAGIPVGMLYSSDYSSLRPGDWIVFSGTFNTRAQADAAASRLQSKGQTGAYSFSIVPAG